MPIYEYVCAVCEHDFEELHRSMATQKGLRCPSCGSDRVERRLSVFAARQAAPKPAEPVPGGGCGRCGDPSGPCGL